MKVAIVNASALKDAGRWDAAYHLGQLGREELEAAQKSVELARQRLKAAEQRLAAALVRIQEDEARVAAELAAGRMRYPPLPVLGRED